MADNVLRYTLSLQDAVSGSLQNIVGRGSSAVDVFARLRTQTLQVSTTMAGMGTSAGSLQMRLNALRAERDWIPSNQTAALRRYNGEIARLEQQIRRVQSTGAGGSWLGNVLNSTPFGGMLTNPWIMAGAVAGKALSVGIADEMATTSFSVLLGSEEAGKKLNADLSKYADMGLYDKGALSQATQTMSSFGIASEQLLPKLKEIGNIAMGDAGKMQSLSLAFAQMSSTGKLTGQDLMQMVNAGFNPLEEISKKTGTSIGDLKEQMGKGKISADMVSEAFTSATTEGGRFNGMAEKMSQTTGGQLKAMMGALNAVFLDLFGIIKPLVLPAMSALQLVFKGIRNVIKDVTTGLKESKPWYLGVASVIGTLVIAMTAVKLGMMAQVLWTSIVTTWNAIQTASWWTLNAAILANPVTWIIAGIIALIALIVFLIYKIDGWGNIWTIVLESMRLSWQVVSDVVASGIDWLTIKWLKLKGLWDDGAKAEIEIIEKQSAQREAAINNTKKVISDNAAQVKWNDKSLADFTGDLKKSLGTEKESSLKSTESSTTPKQDKPTATALGKTSTGGGEGSGTKVRNITINKLVETIIIKVDRFNDSKEDIRKAVTEALITAVNDTNLVH